MSKIGILLNEKQEMASLADGSNVVIYAKKDGKWVPTEEIVECFKKYDARTQMRALMAELIQEMKCCKILVASVLTGIPYMILDNEGFMICEAEEFSEQLLDEIAFDYEKAKEDERLKQSEIQEDYPNQPVETDNAGVFRIDLKKLMKAHPEMTSKKALLPFLQKGVFYQLQVYCDHVMPWLTQHPVMERYKFNSMKLESGGYLVSIEKKCCTE